MQIDGFGSILVPTAVFLFAISTMISWSYYGEKGVEFFLGRKAVLPYAMPGILTASVLGVTRVAGETAPIMFTAAVAAKDKLPWENLGDGGFFSQSVQSLPYHIFTVSARIPQTEYTRPMQYGSVFVFMVMVMCLSGLSVWMRTHYRGKLKW